MLAYGCLICIYIYKCKWRPEEKYEAPSSLNRNPSPFIKHGLLLASRLAD